MKAKYIRGYDLNESETGRVKAAFVHRDTSEHPWSPVARAFLNESGKCIPSDRDWIAQRAFRFYKSGEPAGCLPLSAVTADMLHERSQYGAA